MFLALFTNNEVAKSASGQDLKDVKTSLGKLNSELDTLKTREKVQNETLNRLCEKMNKEEKDGSAGLKEIREKQVKMRSELDVIGKQVRV